MKRRELLAAAIVLGLLCSCSEPTSPNPPIDEAVGVTAISSKVVVGAVESEVAELPAVKVYRVSDGGGVAGRRVVFTLVSPAGGNTTVEVPTGADGVARLPGWRLGRDAGRYAATAVTDGWGPIAFTVLVPGAIVALYGLESVDGRPVPSADWNMMEGHYVLYAGGFYNAFYDRGVEEFNTADGIFGTYSRAGSSINFSTELPAFGGGRVTHSFSARVSGNEMTLQRGHALDFPVEVFILR